MTPEQKKKPEEKLKEDKTWKTSYNCAAWASECWNEVTDNPINAKDPEALGVPTPRKLGKECEKKNNQDREKEQKKDNGQKKDDESSGDHKGSSNG